MEKIKKIGMKKMENLDIHVKSKTQVSVPL